MGVFKGYEKSKADPQIHALIRYLINWVAGTKLIFIALLIVLMILGDTIIKIVSIGALILSIAVFYGRMYPIIKKLDGEDQIEPAGYSKTLAIVIAGFIGVFSLTLIIYFLF